MTGQAGNNKQRRIIPAVTAIVSGSVPFAFVYFVLRAVTGHFSSADTRNALICAGILAVLTVWVFFVVKAVNKYNPRGADRSIRIGLFIGAAITLVGGYLMHVQVPMGEVGATSFRAMIMPLTTIVALIEGTFAYFIFNGKDDS